MRLIDADALMETLNEFPYVKHAIDLLIESQPTIDAVPVVRCKDCKHWKGRDNRCASVIGVWFDDDYCSRAERKEE